MNISDRVKDANRIIYNRMGADYESLDGRRSESLLGWIRARLLETASFAEKKDVFLDVGCGAGFVSTAARGIFSRSYGVDISECILKRAHERGAAPICADAGRLPLKDESIDCASLFSVLHHLYDYRPVLDEIYRVLKHGGTVYIDHDMNSYFYKNFKLFIKLYRRFAHKNAVEKDSEARRLYGLSEFHSDGIDTVKIKEYLERIGFSVKNNFYHWYGLSKITDSFFGKKTFRKETAPLAGFIIQKKKT